MAQLSLFLMGSLTATGQEHRTVEFRYDKVRALLAYLAVESHRAHRRDALVGLLWPDLPDESARTNLRQALASLRSAIDDRTADPPLILASRESVQLNPEADWWSDVTAFSELYQVSSEHSHRRVENCAACAERYAQAIKLYRGDFLEQFFVADSAPFEEWAALKREAVRRQALEALSHLLAYHERHGEYEQAERYARRLLELEPWHEEGNRHLMRLLVLSGKRPQALAQYEHFRRVLEEELGVEPDPETTTLCEQIRSQGPLDSSHLRVPTVRSHNLPPQPTPFVGRERELTAIAALLDNPSCRLLTLVGVGGVGKTRLALQAATQQLDAFNDGVCFVSLAPLASEDALLAAVCEAVQCPLSGAERPKAQLLRFLHDKELLLVLDNFEHLLECAYLLAEIQAAAPDVSLVVTSRERLRLQSEWLFEVEGLSYPPKEAPLSVQWGDELSDRYGAMKLFLRTASRLHPGFEPSLADLHATARICQLVEGMPLAIELAAAWVRVLSCRQIAQEIEQGIEVLSHSLRDVAERHRSLRAVFDHSWAMLTPDEQRVFRRLSVFRGGCTREAADQVAGASPVILAELIDKSLLRHTPEERYELHELVRQYGGDILQQAGEERETRDKHLAFFCDLAEAADPHLKEMVSVSWVDRLETEHDNLRSALAWSLAEGDGEAGLGLATKLWHFWWMRGYTVEGRNWLCALIDQNPTAPPALRAKALRAAGGLVYYLSDLQGAAHYFSAALQLFREVDDKDGVSRALRNLAAVTGDLGKFSEARTFAEESLALARQVGDPQNLANALSDLGINHYYLGEIAQALPYLEESLALDRARGDKHDIAIRLHNLAELLAVSGELARATPLFQESISLFREVQNRFGVAFSLQMQADVEVAQGNCSQAQMLIREAAELFRELGETHGQALCVFTLARLALAKNYREQAAQLLGVVDALFEKGDVSFRPPEKAQFDAVLELVQAQLDVDCFATSWQAGHALSLEQALNEALHSSL